MLCQVLKGTGEANVHLTDILDALKMAITNPSANGERELPDTLPRTPGNNPHTSTENVILDGADFGVYRERFIVAPNIVNYQGQQLQHVTDWDNLISEMYRQNQWTATKSRNPRPPNQILDSIERSNGKPKSKASTPN